MLPIYTELAILSIMSTALGLIAIELYPERRWISTILLITAWAIIIYMLTCVVPKIPDVEVVKWSSVNIERIKNVGVRSTTVVVRNVTIS